MHEFCAVKMELPVCIIQFCLFSLFFCSCGHFGWVGMLASLAGQRWVLVVKKACQARSWTAEACHFSLHLHGSDCSRTLEHKLLILSNVSCGQTFMIWWSCWMSSSWFKMLIDINCLQNSVCVCVCTHVCMCLMVVQQLKMDQLVKKLEEWQSAANELSQCFLQGDALLAIWNGELSDWLDNLQLVAMLFQDCIKVSWSWSIHRHPAENRNAEEASFLETLSELHFGFLCWTEMRVCSRAVVCKISKQKEEEKKEKERRKRWEAEKCAWSIGLKWLYHILEYLESVRHWVLGRDFNIQVFSFFSSAVQGPEHAQKRWLGRCWVCTSE